MSQVVVLCGQQGCRLQAGHGGQHLQYPTAAWGFMQPQDRDKLTKAGFATPRGGNKGAYQNHVLRSNRVIVPYERLGQVDLDNYNSGYVIRLFPEQYFSGPGQVRPEFVRPDAPVQVGVNAFILYRTHESLTGFPPPAAWSLRGLKRGEEEVSERGRDVTDVGHYVKRIPRLGKGNAAVEEGPPQGIFAPEYADEETNFLCRCVLAWLIANCRDSPYTSQQAGHIEAILVAAGMFKVQAWESKGVTRAGVTCCPLCLHFLAYRELHEMVSFSDEAGVGNASEQVEGATRSTVVNLFHMLPLTYASIEHIPANVAWGHAICNTRLGQRVCHSLTEVMDAGLKVGVVTESGIRTFGWITSDFEMIRSPRGAVWIRLHPDMTDEEWEWKPTVPEEPDPAALPRDEAE